MKRFIRIFLLIFLFAGFSSAAVFAQTTEYKMLHMGNRAFRAQHYDEAHSYYMKVLKNNPNNTRAIFNLADTYLAQKNSQAADSLYNQVTQLEKNKQICSMAWHNRGYINQVLALHNPKQQQGLLRQAIEHYKQALRLNPRDNDTRYNLALCQRQLKEQESQSEQQEEKSQGQDQTPQQEEKNNPKQEQMEKTDKQNKQQMEQYINLAKQAEKKALEKLKNQQPRQKSLDKNW